VEVSRLKPSAQAQGFFASSWTFFSPPTTEQLFDDPRTPSDQLNLCNAPFSQLRPSPDASNNFSKPRKIPKLINKQPKRCRLLVRQFLFATSPPQTFAAALESKSS
jgi:hypothetical protein